MARLLGMPVLRVDGVVQLAPARLEPLDAALPARTQSTGPLGIGLVRASRLIEDGDRRLR